MRTSNLIAIIACVTACVSMRPLAAAEAQPGEEAWTAPPEAAAIANPVEATAESVAKGKALYEEHCLDCHGATGAGEGDGAALLGIKVGSLKDPKVASQSDGALFWKTNTGKGDMPGFRKDNEEVLTEDAQTWHLVNYLRSLAPPAE